jgi:tetratricopeptide (TPR) repeat protein
VHLIDPMGFGGVDPVAGVAKIDKELATFSSKLTQKPRVLAVNKMDLPEGAKALALVKKKYRARKVIGVSVATGYSLKRATSPNGPFTTIARVPETSYVDRAVTNGTTYYYTVRSATGVIKGPLSPQVQATPAAPPLVPTNLSAAPGHGTIALSWNPAPGATRYYVKRAATADGPFEKAVEHGSGSAEVLNLYALFRARRKQFAKAMPAIDRAITLDPLNPALFKTKGRIHFANGEYPAAIAAAQRALVLNPSISGAHGDIGNAQLMLGKPAEAECLDIIDTSTAYRASHLAVDFA